MQLIAQHFSAVQVALANAEILNNSISPAQLPEENEQFMNNISLLYYLQGRNSIVSFYSQILGIAMQCPDAGGKAVYRARPFVELFNDSVEYDDINVCYQAGIYRINLTPQGQEKEVIQIIPNPANDNIDVVLNYAITGICKIEISNVLGAVILKDEMNCKEKIHNINTRNLISGVYTVKVYHNTTTFKIAKLVIER